MPLATAKAASTAQKTPQLKSSIGHSSNTSKSSSSRLTSTIRFPTLNLAPFRSSVGKSRVAITENPTSLHSTSNEEIRPRSISGIPSFVSTVSFKTVLRFFHVPNLSNASLDEAIFLHVFYSSLATQARMLAAILPWSLQRPLRALLAAMNEPGKSYTKQNAKHKRPSNSLASLKRRSRRSDF